MIPSQHLDKMANYIRNRLDSLFDATSIFTEEKSLKEQLVAPHKGLYVGITSSRGEMIVREGFLKEGLQNVRDSAEVVVNSLFDALKNKNVSANQLKTATFDYSVVTDCIYLPDPLQWDENKDGIYFLWGDRYKALYLPHQIRKLNMSKIEILDRLCSWEAGVASNLWRLPESLIWRLVCQSHTA